MTGRGIDQILPHPNAPDIHESYVKNALGYVMLAERVNGPIQIPVDFSYIWGEALAELERVAPDVRIINLETAVTSGEEYEDKGINYRMHPDNIRCITVAKTDCCSLANNHILDWGHSGLVETLETLAKAKILSAGAGRNLKEAEAPAVITAAGKGRVIVFSFGSETSGIPPGWAATPDRPGVNFLANLSDKKVRHIGEKVKAVKQQGDVVVISLHWGGNWGYEIPHDHIDFAHALIDAAGVDVIYGHSSHHVKGLEVYKDKLVLYGCGDFLSDYEGISGHEFFRDDLGLMYFAKVDPLTGRLASLRMIPTQIRRFKVNLASREDAQWLADVLNREGKRFGTSVLINEDNTLLLKIG